MRSKQSLSLAILTTLLILPAVPAGAAQKPELWAFWEAENPSSTTAVDHGAWQQFLDSHVVRGDDGINRVDYSGVQPSQHALLTGYLEQLSRIDPRTFSRAEQLAYWINLYNALTVELVLRHPDKGSILRMGNGLLSIGPWDDELIEVAGQMLTLNDIEHRILRPIWKDLRVHYAINCASIGCPNLSGDAYRAATIERQLDAAEAGYVNHDRAVSFNDDGKLMLSSIYKWYRRDFASNEAALLDYLASKHNTLAVPLRAYHGAIGYRYDWNLNRLADQ